MQGRLALGRVGAGVVVRSDAPSPEIATTDALKRALLSADSIVYNTASTGLYLEKLFERIGIAEQIKARTTRYPKGEDVMDHIIKGRGNELGFGYVLDQLDRLRADYAEERYRPSPLLRRLARESAEGARSVLV